MDQVKDLMEILEKKLIEGAKLLNFCDDLSAKHVNGAAKLKRKIFTEIENLEELKKDPCRLQVQHLAGNNLIHFQAICDSCLRYENVVAVLAPFRRPDTSTITIDIVADNGATWIKAIARSAKGLHFSWSGETCSRERSIVDQGQDYFDAASCNLYHYQAPRVIFEFNAGLTEPIYRDLKALGISVKGNIVPFDDDTELNSDDDSSDSELENENDVVSFQTTDDFTNGQTSDASNLSINLDITAIFAYISNLTNDGANYNFKQPVLDHQAACERLRPVLPGLKSVMNGRRLICCKTAYDSFLDILKTVGGDEEKRRGAELCKTIEVVEDRITDIVSNLQLGGKIKPRSKIIFGSGDFYKAVTLTANKSFVQAAASQGYKFAVIIHESRALSEQKQQHAAPISANCIP